MPLRPAATPAAPTLDGTIDLLSAAADAQAEPAMPFPPSRARKRVARKASPKPPGSSNSPASSKPPASPKPSGPSKKKAPPKKG